MSVLTVDEWHAEIRRLAIHAAQVVEHGSGLTPTPPIALCLGSLAGAFHILKMLTEAGVPLTDEEHAERKRVSEGTLN